MVNFRLTSNEDLQTANSYLLKITLWNVCFCHYNSNWLTMSLQTQLLSCYETLLDRNN